MLYRTAGYLRTTLLRQLIFLPSGPISVILVGFLYVIDLGIPALRFQPNPFYPACHTTLQLSIKDFTLSEVKYKAKDILRVVSFAPVAQSLLSGKMSSPKRRIEADVSYPHAIDQ